MTKAENLDRTNHLCFMLDDKDSVILSARITYDDYWASIAYTFSGDAKDGVNGWMHIDSICMLWIKLRR